MTSLRVILVTTSLFVVACSTSAPPPNDKTSAQAEPSVAQPAAAAQPNGRATSPPAPEVASAPATPEQSAASTARPAAPPEPQAEQVSVPAGTSLTITLTTAVASDTSKVEDSVHGTLAKPIVVGGKTVVPQGAEISGVVTEANESGRVKGRASIALQFDRLVVRDESHQIRTARVRREAEADTSGDVKKGALGAGAGAIIGGIAGGGKGAAIGAAVGGAGTVLATKGKEISLPEGSTVTTTLQESLTVAVPITSGR